MYEKQRTREVLKNSSNFGKLDDQTLNEFIERLSFLPVQGGTLVLHEGDESNTVIILISGRLRVWRRAQDGSYLRYNEIGPGESVGETGMILGFRRTANVTALRDSLLAILSNSEFEALLVRQPLAINRVFSQSIYDYLRHSVNEGVKVACKFFAVIPLDERCSISDVALSLTAALNVKGKAHHQPALDIEDRGNSGLEITQTIDQLDALERSNNFLLFETRHDLSAWTLKAIHQCDQIIYVISADNPDPRLTDLEQRLSDIPGFALKRKHLILLHADKATRSVATSTWQQHRDIERVYPIRRGNADDYGRLVRFLTDSAVGVVLGGGGARGFAHIGALKAFEEAGIPIDLMGGNSMGALIGAQYMMGVPLAEIGERTRRFALGGEYPTLPLVSLLSGRRMERDLKRMFGDTQIDTLWRTFFATACNLSQADTTIQDHGDLWRAVMASNSPAGLLPPVILNGDLLVDGAILDNVPVAAMRVRLGTPLEKRRGNGTVIAIDVDVSDELKVPADTQRLSSWEVLKSRLRLTPTHQPGIGDILYRASHLGSMQLRARTAAMADHYLEPPVAEFPLMGYRQAEAIIDVGYRYASGQVKQWNFP